MTTLTATSSPDLAGPNWVRIVALYGVGPLISVMLLFWLTGSVDAKLDTAIAEQRAMKAVIEKHVEHNHEDLERLLEVETANCKNGARTQQARTLCEAWR